jgi:SAM-dependent methyltransferase
MPSEAFLQEHYQRPGYFDGDEEQGYASYADMRKALLPHFRRRLRAMDTYLPTRGRLLDFGCAAGYFLELARDRGWDIAGVELAREMAHQAELTLGIPVAPSLDQLGAGTCDVITLWEVVEHLPRPLATMKELLGRLRPGGVVMLSTPNTGHWQAVREPDNWVGYRPPSHLLFFTEETLRGVLQRAGFERIVVRRVAPLPPLPRWLRRASASLQHGLANGQARPWPLALLTWRGVRLAGWGWQRLASPRDDIFTTLEVTAFRAQ